MFDRVNIIIAIGTLASAFAAWSAAKAAQKAAEETRNARLDEFRPILNTALYNQGGLELAIDLVNRGKGPLHNLILVDFPNTIFGKTTLQVDEVTRCVIEASNWTRLDPQKMEIKFQYVDIYGRHFETIAHIDRWEGGMAAITDITVMRQHQIL
ncbi:MAG TPA: hypothetical protein VMR46_01715 [Candidatus Paceibacterota bacterium]|nr:hypothetical protein [Candidatus Paceibacterota bacterium]